MLGPRLPLGATPAGRRGGGRTVILLATRWWLSSWVYRSKAVNPPGDRNERIIFARLHTPHGQSPGDAALRRFPRSRGSTTSR